MRSNLRNTRRDRRGAALVLVLIFGVGALMLVTTMLTLAESGAKGEGERHRLKTLSAVIRMGMADAVREINLFREQGASYVDPEGNGPGAVMGPGNAGVAVTAPSGELLGRYRTMVDRTTYAPKAVLIVVATTSTFTDERATMAAAEVEILWNPGTPGTEASPLSLVGPINPDDSDIDVEGSGDFDITAPDLDTPAVNITDSSYRTRFISDVLPSIDQVYGSDFASLGAPAVGAGTISNNAAGFISETTLLNIRDGAEDIVANNLAGATTISGPGTYNNPTGFYKISSLQLDAGQAIKGSGTLIITDGFTAKKDAIFEWKGTIIVQQQSNAKLNFNKDAFVRIGGDTGATDAGELRPAGATAAASNPVEPSVVVILGVDQDAKLDIKKDANVEVNGAFIMASYSTDPDDTDAKIKIKKDFDATFNGIFAVLAEDAVELSIDKDSETKVNGTLGIVTRGLDRDEGDSGGEIDVKIKKDSLTKLTFDNDIYMAARQKLLDYFGGYFTSGGDPAKITSYWERSAVVLLAQQETIIATVADDDDWGVEK